ncbi:hypothetical protein RCL1_007378 [Eukaryota sp. TZLM3-RCL]
MTQSQQFCAARIRQCLSTASRKPLLKSSIPTLRKFLNPFFLTAAQQDIIPHSSSYNDTSDCLQTPVPSSSSVAIVDELIYEYEYDTASESDSSVESESPLFRSSDQPSSSSSNDSSSNDSVFPLSFSPPPTTSSTPSLPSSLEVASSLSSSEELIPCTNTSTSITTDLPTDMDGTVLKVQKEEADEVLIDSHESTVNSQEKKEDIIEQEVGLQDESNLIVDTSVNQTDTIQSIPNQQVDIKVEIDTEVKQQETTSQYSQVIDFSTLDATVSPKYSSYFYSYIPPNWFFLHFSELVLSCLRFYHTPITFEFVLEAVQDVMLISKAKNEPKPTRQITTTWKKYLRENLMKFTGANGFVHYDSVSKTFRLSALGRDAFTSIGANSQSPDGNKYLGIYCKPKLVKDKFPDRLLPVAFEYKTVYEVLGGVAPLLAPTPPRIKEKKEVKREVKKEEVEEEPPLPPPTPIGSTPLLNIEPAVSIRNAPISTPCNSATKLPAWNDVASTKKRSCTVTRARTASSLSNSQPQIKRPRRTVSRDKIDGFYSSPSEPRNQSNLIDCEFMNLNSEPIPSLFELIKEKVFDVSLIKKMIREVGSFEVEELQKLLPAVDDVSCNSGIDRLFLGNKYLKFCFEFFNEDLLVVLTNKAEGNMSE